MAASPSASILQFVTVVRCGGDHGVSYDGGLDMTKITVADRTDDQATLRPPESPQRVRYVPPTLEKAGKLSDVTPTSVANRSSRWAGNYTTCPS
jgi:hypothetical protein